MINKKNRTETDQKPKTEPEQMRKRPEQSKNLITEGTTFLFILKLSYSSHCLVVKNDIIHLEV